ncbi:DUF6586 family protein [Pseudomonas aeruginosa]|uniref:DUF6586 family protein n=1 Tax=Pseudomonas aeruginosa TaxID=287 RepID=UPI0004083DF6|nr:DUF6586 family protein [Pseudomonas aeruginosa]EIU5570798.1 PasA protein [Pseudomonas aeruginosa]EKY1196181.1 PasA protein [Pseudomonas aeruginosa]ELK4798459.1 PasA protein [Pseudomonas aeruginosa]ELK4803441.1 PasA protein [Pseudomonas aeruginosa]ELK4827507.1 PasA protein [Pseudomonas aeruginosa]
MAQELYTRTNQKLYFAGLALEAWKRADAERAMNAQAIIQGERESALFHLYGAVLGVCHEIAGYYRLPQAAAPRVDALLNAEVLVAAPSPELAELVELASQPETWLGQLLGAYSELFLPPRPTKAAKIDPSTPLIVAVSIDEDAPLLSRETLEEWRQSLKQLVLRFRESLTEL